MRTTRPRLAAVLAGALAGTLSACAYTSSSPLASYPELPPPSHRLSVGLWDLGDNNCRGSIQVGGGSAYWVVDCRVRAGHGHCTHGLPLVRRDPHRYASTDGRITFTISEADGTLEEAKNGKLYRRYSSLDGAICGATAPAAAND